MTHATLASEPSKSLGWALGSRSPRPEQRPSLVPAMAAEASPSLADTANDLFLFVAQRRSTPVPTVSACPGQECPSPAKYCWRLI
jgi:hypothetical protein